MAILKLTQQHSWLLGAGAGFVGLCAMVNVAAAQEEQVIPEQAPAAVATPAPEATPKEPEEKVRTGAIASTGRFGTTGGVDVDSAGASPGDEPSVVAASISRKNRTECIAKIINNGKKSYSVSFTVLGEDHRGNRVINRSFSGSVASKGTLERQISGCRDDLNLSVTLNSAKSGR